MDAERPASATMLRLERVGVRFATARGEVVAADEVSLGIEPGECLALVGESGAGKSQLALAVLGLLASNGRASGSVCFEGRELLGLSQAELDRVRGAGMGAVFQDPLTSLTPHLTIGAQLGEVLARHRGLGGGAARTRARELLGQVQIGDAALRLAQYPHELSGGMRQRVMLALALAGEPRLLIADEPTTSLDVTVQAQVLALLAALKRTRHLAMLLVTHDLGAVAGIADRVAVMRGGRLLETGAVARVLGAPREDYTRSLLAQARALLAAPSSPPPAASGAPVLGVEDLAVRFRLPRAPGGAAARAGTSANEGTAALEGVTVTLHAGEGLGIVGESGSGKSTLVRAALALLAPTRGRVVWLGEEPARLPAAAVRARRRNLQLVFQDPLGSLDPRMTVGALLAEPLTVHVPQLDQRARSQAVADALGRVALDPALAHRYPHELSGGQCQRIGIARAMMLGPRVLVCDEPLSALDAPTQEQIVALLESLVQASGTALMLISHNLALVRRLCSRVLVLYRGRMTELAASEALFGAPLHPYTRELLAAVPCLDPAVQPARLAAVRTLEPPVPQGTAAGCGYAQRCPHAVTRCRTSVPAWSAIDTGRHVACHLWKDLPPHC